MYVLDYVRYNSVLRLTWLGAQRRRGRRRAVATRASNLWISLTTRGEPAEHSGAAHRAAAVPGFRSCPGRARRTNPLRGERACGTFVSKMRIAYLFGRTATETSSGAPRPSWRVGADCHLASHDRRPASSCGQAPRKRSSCRHAQIRPSHRSAWLGRLLGRSQSPWHHRSRADGCAERALRGSRLRNREPGRVNLRIVLRAERRADQEQQRLLRLQLTRRCAGPLTR
jgi:hypothetical protein